MSQSVGKSVFDLSHRRLTSFGYGQLIPVMNIEVLPDDVFENQSFIHIQQSPLLAPTKHDINAYIEYWYVPNRLLWTGRRTDAVAETAGDNWEDFITGGEDGKNAAVVPTITSANSARFEIGSLWDHLRLPVGDSGYIPNQTVSALPFRAYNLIYNTHYRNANVQTTKLPISYVGGADTTTYPSDSSTGIAYRNWLGSYFSTALPWSQKGDEVNLPIGDSANVIGDGNTIGLIQETVKSGLYHSSSIGLDNRANVYGMPQNSTVSGGAVYTTGQSVGLTTEAGKSGMIVDLAGATGPNINDLRFAVVTQRIKEKLASITNNVYKSYLRVFHGVETSDGRVDVPEFLGGGMAPIVVSSSLQTSATDTGTSSQTKQGNPVGFGVASKLTFKFRRRFEEHGWVIALISVIPEEMYMQGIHPSMLRTTRYDYPLPDYCGLGMQAITNNQVYAAHSSPTGIFGYQYRYNECRHEDNSVHGMFRNTLSYHHVARKFTSDPSLNDNFLKCSDSSNLRIHAIQNEDPLWVHVFHNLKAVRRLTKVASPSLMDYSL